MVCPEPRSSTFPISLVSVFFLLRFYSIPPLLMSLDGEGVFPLKKNGDPQDGAYLNEERTGYGASFKPGLRHGAVETLIYFLCGCWLIAREERDDQTVVRASE